jgi:hypothetical protein
MTRKTWPNSAAANKSLCLGRVEGPRRTARMGCSRGGVVGREGGTITRRHREREDAEGEEKNVGWVGEHINGRKVGRKDIGEVVEGNDHAETLRNRGGRGWRLQRSYKVSVIRYQLCFYQRAWCGIYAGEVVRGFAGEVVWDLRARSSGICGRGTPLRGA